MDSTALVLSPQVQADHDQFDSLSDRASRACTVSHNPIVSLGYFISVPIRACRSGRRLCRTNRNDLEWIWQLRRVHFWYARVAYQLLPPERPRS